MEEPLTSATWTLPNGHMIMDAQQKPILAAVAGSEGSARDLSSSAHTPSCLTRDPPFIFLIAYYEPTILIASKAVIPKEIVAIQPHSAPPLVAAALDFAASIIWAADAVSGTN